jgi:hypothetical protein
MQSITTLASLPCARGARPRTEGGSEPGPRAPMGIHQSTGRRNRRLFIRVLLSVAREDVRVL